MSDHSGIPPGVRALLSEERLDGLSVDGPILSFRQDAPRGDDRFEGIYGGLYDRVIKSPRLRRAAFSLWGSTDPLSNLEGFVHDAVRSVDEPAPVLVDVPCGGGTLLPILAGEGFAGTVVEVDLARTMLQRAVVLHRSRAFDLETVFLQDDALDLSLASRVADVTISINGLHLMPDPARFLAELARIAKPGGSLWLITPVNGPSLRSRAILRAARTFGITPGTPPTLGELGRLLDQAGFERILFYGGRSITGVACRKTDAS